MTEPQLTQVGRNEPCPCGSGKKYKRCCGVSAAPKITPPKDPFAENPMDLKKSQEMLANMDPQVVSQFTNALQRLPKGQLQRIQSMMQRAMSGKDVSAEAEALEKSLPPDFQVLMQSMAASMGGMGGMGDMSGLAGMAPPALPETTDTSEMTEERAREIVAQALKEGAISEDKAQALLNTPTTESKADVVTSEETQKAPESSKFGKFWKNIGKGSSK